MYNHQDWEPVVIKKNPAKTTSASSSAVARSRVQNNNASTSSINNKPAWKIEQQVDGDVGKPMTLVSKEDGAKITRGRVAMKLSQKDLAMKLNLPAKTIQDIENGKAVENKALLSKIRKMLNIII